MNIPTRVSNLNILFLQYCMMEHFFNSDYKILCCSMSELPQKIKSLRKEQLEELRQLPSFRRYVDVLPKKEKAPLLLDDDHFKVSKVCDYSKSSISIFRCVFNLFHKAQISFVISISLPVSSGTQTKGLISVKLDMVCLHYILSGHFDFGLVQFILRTMSLKALN